MIFECINFIYSKIMSFIKPFLDYSAILKQGLENYQNLLGTEISVFRVKDQETDKYFNVYGPSKVRRTSPRNLEFVKKVKALNAPTELHISLHANAEELSIVLGKDDLQVGDILRFIIKENIVLDYLISELPQTVHENFFIYKAVSMFNVRTV